MTGLGMAMFDAKDARHRFRSSDSVQLEVFLPGEAIHCFEYGDHSVHWCQSLDQKLYIFYTRRLRYLLRFPTALANCLGYVQGMQHQSILRPVHVKALLLFFHIP